MEGAHKAAQCPWEQQESQSPPLRMLLQATSAGTYARRGPWTASARSKTAAIVRRSTALSYQVAAILEVWGKTLPAPAEPSVQMRLQRSALRCDRPHGRKAPVRRPLGDPRPAVGSRGRGKARD